MNVHPNDVRLQKRTQTFLPATTPGNFLSATGNNVTIFIKTIIAAGQYLFL
jgi:hypothetical protein